MSKNGNGKTVEQIARDTVDRLGADAVPFLRERTEEAQAIGDDLAATTWRDIADIAEGMLLDPCRLLNSTAARVS